VRPPGAAAGLVLASRSPQRRAILETLGVPFAVRPADVAEATRGDPVEVAMANALRKARAVAAADGEVVLGVDTLVALGGRIYGKPPDAAAAAATLRALSGARHTVVSGIALLGAGAAPRRAAAETTVRFRRLDDATIDWYVGAGEWRERAGGYAIQGRGMALVSSIDGDYANVVGLPVAALLDLWPELLAGAA
jgi:septum formation protein